MFLLGHTHLSFYKYKFLRKKKESMVICLKGFRNINFCVFTVPVKRLDMPTHSYGFLYVDFLYIVENSTEETETIE